MVKVRALKKFEHTLDATTGNFRYENEEWEVDETRAKLLFDNGYVVIVGNAEPDHELVELEKPKKRGRKKKN